MLSAQWTVEWEHVCKLSLASFWGFHDLMAADLYCLISKWLISVPIPCKMSSVDPVQDKITDAKAILSENKPDEKKRCTFQMSSEHQKT